MFVKKQTTLIFFKQLIKSLNIPQYTPINQKIFRKSLRKIENNYFIQNSWRK